MAAGRISALERLEQQAARVHEIVRVLAKYRLAGWMISLPIPKFHGSVETAQSPEISSMRREERIRLAIAELGPTFIKVGQILSTRADLVGEELATEFAKLQSHTESDPPEIVRQTIADDLGAPPEELFATFEEHAFASASIAQVHRATLHSGELVAVKVQKAGIRHIVQNDLAIMDSLAQLAEKHINDLKAYEPVRLVREFRQILWNELDFTREMANIERFTANFSEDETVRFPIAWPAFSSRSVLTMELLEGIPAADLVNGAPEGTDLEEFAQRGAAAYMNMIFRDSFYHADPHPGNIMLLPGNIVGIIDCGMVGRLDEGLHADFASLILSLVSGDSEELTDSLWMLSQAFPTLSRSDLQSELSDLLAGSTNGSISSIHLGEAFSKLSFIFRKFKIRPRPGLTGLLKTLVELEGTAQQLSPNFSLAVVMAPYYTKIQMERLSPEFWVKRRMRIYREWDKLAEDLPRNISKTLQQVQTGKIQVRLDHRHLNAVVNRLVLGLIVASLLLGSSLLWSMKAPPLIGGISLVGVAGFGVALFIGMLLFKDIEKPKAVDPEE